jgi:hypothetical protein
VWVNGQLVTSTWDGSPSYQIHLTAGESYDFVTECREDLRERLAFRWRGSRPRIGSWHAIPAEVFLVRSLGGDAVGERGGCRRWPPSSRSVRCGSGVRRGRDDARRSHPRRRGGGGDGTHASASPTATVGWRV